MTTELKGGHTTEDPRLDRLPEFDERSRAYTVAPLVEDKPLRSWSWYAPGRYNQGSEGACVGFSWTHELAAYPVIVVPEDPEHFAYTVYREAQKLDQWPGEDYEGTSIIAGAKALQRRKLLGEYRWAFSLEDALRALVHEGPVILGCNWYSTMYDVDEDGFISPEGGERVGGHAIMIRGYRKAFKHKDGRVSEAIRLRNSWGSDWGLYGDCWMTVEDFKRLFIDERGEVCIPVDRMRGSENTLRAATSKDDYWPEPEDAGHDDHPEERYGLEEGEETPFDEMIRSILDGEDIPSETPLQASSQPLEAGVIISRAQWGARAPRNTSRISNVKGVALHWAGGNPYGSFNHSRCFHLVRGIQNYHMNSNGWADVAYSGIVCPHGYVFEGRGPNRRTAANGTNSGNSGWYALCYLGSTGDPFTAAGKRGFKEGISWLRSRGGAGSNHRPHSWFKATSCPGNVIRNWLSAGMPVEGTTPAPAPTPPQKEEDIMASLEELDDLLKRRTGILRERANEAVRLSESAAAGSIADIRHRLGLDPDAASDAIHVSRIRKGDFGGKKYDMKEVRSRLEQAAEERLNGGPRMAREIEGTEDDLKDN